MTTGSSTPKLGRWSGRSTRTSTPSSTTSESFATAGDHLKQMGRKEADDRPNGIADAATPALDQLAAAGELHGETETEQGKFKALLGILRQSISVKDLSSVRISLPANMMEPVGNLEHWQYIDRPDYFAALADVDGADELTRILALLRWLFTKELKFAKHPIAKPFNSILGEHFHCYYDTPLVELHPDSGQPVPSVHLDVNPCEEVLISAGRNASSNATSAAALKSSPSVTSISKRNVGSGEVRSSASSIASATGSTTPSSSSLGTSTPSRPKARVVILNEQTSHHPPVSHFLCEARLEPGTDRQRTVRLRGVDHLSATFTASGAVRIVPGAHNKGLFLELADGEEWLITHPTAAVAGLLRASPYATICDSTTVTCVREGSGRGSAKEETAGTQTKRLRAIIEYREESWITRPRFAVDGVVYESFAGEADTARGGAGSGTIQSPESNSTKRFSKIKQVPKERVVALLEGNWRGQIRWKKPSQTDWTTLVDLVPLAVAPKSVAPLSEQDELETRRVWAPVIEALHKKDYVNASKEKQRIEQVQREKAEQRKKNGERYEPRFFQPEPEDLAEWDGRPVLSEAGRAALERDFQANYTESS